MVEFLEHRVQVAAKPLVFAHAEDLGDDVGRQAEHPQFTRRSKILWIGKWRRKTKFRQYSTWFNE